MRRVPSKRSRSESPPPELQLFCFYRYHPFGFVPRDYTSTAAVARYRSFNAKCDPVSLFVQISSSLPHSLSRTRIDSVVKRRLLYLLSRIVGHIGPSEPICAFYYILLFEWLHDCMAPVTATHVGEFEPRFSLNYLQTLASLHFADMSRSSALLIHHYTGLYGGSQLSLLLRRAMF